MHLIRTVVLIMGCWLAATGAQAGLYYSGERLAELPSQWRGFLLDYRALRMLAVKPAAGSPPSPLRARYAEALATLEASRGRLPLAADQKADLGALYLRGETGKALELLRAASREHPLHFRIAANLGTAWQIQGDLEQSAAALQQAVRLAPGKFVRAEEFQLKLVRGRQRKGTDTQALDDLFGIRYLGPNGVYAAGEIAMAERKKLPSDAVALAQQLALWLPADGRLLWQLGELANAQGDVKTAAAILDGCVTELNMHATELRQHRQILRAAADALAQASDAPARATHEGHAGVLKPRSRRPLLHRLGVSELPAIQANGVTPLPWAVLADTVVERPFKPEFVPYLRELDGKQVSLSGFMQPLGTDLELSSFLLIEYPVGCWYCEMPELSSIVLVELTAGKTATLSRNLTKVTGKLRLNASDPESFLYAITNAKVAEAD